MILSHNIEIEGLMICSNYQVLFTVLLNEEIKSQDELFERTSFLVASYCVFHGRDPQDLKILVIPKKSLMEILLPKVDLLLKSIGGSLDSNVKITPRQKEILNLVCLGKSNKEIASAACISERTAKFHVSSLLSRFGVQDRRALVYRVMGGIADPAKKK